MDPPVEKYYSVSPYAYCGNDPVRFVDPSGMSPVYDPYGNFLGTDDEGIAGNALVIDTKDLETKDTLFWIVNKTEQKTEHFLDSLEFYNFLKKEKLIYS
ncbi:MAG: hypothetical protein LBG15_11550 [Dysgonamonadaceae bacterium]|jgi:hypothetical protein|nr:hypothetical protein [Dysgonamonadaceae bacterium]